MYSLREGVYLSAVTDGDRLREVLAHRHRLLARLTEGSADKPTLVADLPVARSTVDRGIRDLEEVGCVERVDGEFRANAAGRAALEAFGCYADATDGVAAAQSLLTHLPPDAGLPPRMLAGADVHVADDHAPERVITPVARTAQDADRVRATAPVLYSRYLDHLVAVVESGVEFEAVVAQPVVESARDIDPEKVDRLARSDHYDSYITEADLPYAVMLTECTDDATAALVVYDSGAPRGILMNDTDAAVGWAREHYRAVRAEADPADAADLRGHPT